MKKREIKWMIMGFTAVIVLVNVLCNMGFFHYLKDLNHRLIYEECDRVSYNVKNKFDQSLNQLSLYLDRINREVYRIGYFDPDTERRYTSVSVQECADTLNEFLEIPIQLMVIDSTDNTAVNYSRTVNQEMEEKWKSICERMSQKASGGGTETYIRYCIAEEETTFWVIGVQKFFAHNYSKVQNEEKGYLTTLQIIKKEELYEACGVTKDMKIQLYELSNPESVGQAVSGQNVSEGMEMSGQGISEGMEMSGQGISEGMEVSGQEISGQETQVEFTIAREISTIDFSYKLEVALLNERSISKYEDMQVILLMQLVINILLALFWMRMVTHFLAEPLKKITGYLKESGFEDNRRMPETFACIELHDVALHFNQMQERLKKEISHTFYTQQRLYEMELCEKNRELMALQSQINPHFIYNMLENIRVLANEGRDEDIDTVTVSMARFLRYSLYVKGFVTLEDELNAVKNYIEIMRICYDDMFTVTYEIEEEALRSLQVPKMILQPLIGNIFKHAFSFDHEGNCILLKVRRENGQLLISVYDNGDGMSAERLETVKSELSASTLLQKDRGFGLRSVSRRLKTIYGDAYGVELNSSEGEYTEITLKLPCS